MEKQVSIEDLKDILLKDLCARLPYGVKLNCCNIVSEPLTLISYKGLVNNDYDIDEVKPYLFPLSSMSEEQEVEYDATFATIVYEDGKRDSTMTYKSFDWLNKNHFDYRGLIEQGLAIDATSKNIY